MDCICPERNEDCSWTPTLDINKGWREQFTKKFSDNVVPGSHANDLIIGREDGKKVMDFIRSVEAAAEKRGRESAVQEILKIRTFEHHGFDYLPVLVIEEYANYHGITLPSNHE